MTAKKKSKDVKHFNNSPVPLSEAGPPNRRKSARLKLSYVQLRLS